MKLLIALGLLLGLSVYSQAAPRCHLQELWDCADIAINWLHTLPKRQIPETEDDVEIMCTELTKALECAFSYRDNCTTPLQREVIGLTIEGTIELQKDFCTAGSGARAKYLAHSVCLNKISQMDTVKEQIEYILAVFEKAQEVDQQRFISYACCGYSKVMNTFINLGTENCGKEAVEAAQELLGVAIAQLPEVVCSGYSGEEDKCQAILPPEGTKPSDAAKGTMLYQTIKNVLKNWLD